MSRLLALIFLLFLSACSDEQLNRIVKISGSTMGTQYHVIIVCKKIKPNCSSEKFRNHIEKVLLIVNQQMSTYISNSEISRFNQFNKTEWFSVSNDFAFVVHKAQIMSQLTHGAFDITIAPLIDLWGFGKYTINKIPSSAELESIKQYTGYSLLSIRHNPPALMKQDARLRIDLSAIAKGFAVDKISLYLTKIGFNDHLVEIGGEIRSSGRNQYDKLWNIAIANPDASPQSQTENHSIKISNRALATSGNYNNYFLKDGVRYSHTINPATSQPIKHQLASATVMAESAMLADAYATAIMVMGEIKGMEFAKQQKLKVNLIYKENNQFKVWRNLD